LRKWLGNVPGAADEVNRRTAWQDCAADQILRCRPCASRDP